MTTTQPKPQKKIHRLICENPRRLCRVDSATDINIAYCPNCQGVKLHDIESAEGAKLNQRKNKKKSKREHYICNGRMLCLTHATTPPKKCPVCQSEIFHIGSKEGAALKVKREQQKYKFSGGFLAKAPKRRVLNRNIGEAADAVAWQGGR